MGIWDPRFAPMTIWRQYDVATDWKRVYLTKNTSNLHSRSIVLPAMLRNQHTTFAFVELVWEHHGNNA